MPSPLAPPQGLALPTVTAAASLASILFASWLTNVDGCAIGAVVPALAGIGFGLASLAMLALGWRRGRGAGRGRRAVWAAAVALLLVPFVLLTWAFSPLFFE